MLKQSKISVASSSYPYVLRTWLNYSVDDPDVYEYPKGESMTVPEMVPDLRLMLDRAASGLPVPTRNDGYSPEDYPDIFKMDEFELVAFREKLAEDMTKMDEELHVASKKLEEIEDAQRKINVTKQAEEVIEHLESRKKEAP